MLTHRFPSACTWQGFVNQQTKMANAFKAAMAKLSVVGQTNTARFIDCSEVVPAAKPNTKPARFVSIFLSYSIVPTLPLSFPATKTKADLQLSCASAFPNLATDPGAKETIIPYVYLMLLILRDNCLTTRFSHCPGGETTC